MRARWLQWDDANVMHATAHGVSVTEIEQALANAGRLPKPRPGSDRVSILSVTDGGRRVRIVVQLLDDQGVRPITCWERN